MLTRLTEYFGNILPMSTGVNVSVIPPVFYRQGRDWSCSIACLRTLYSVYGDVEDEDSIIRRCGLKPGPCYSRDLIRCGALDGYEFIAPEECERNAFEEIHRVYDYLRQGFPVMVETCRMYDHWTVLLAYITFGEKYADDQQLVMYDPYYNELFMKRASLFYSEWVSGNYPNNKVMCDFIAITGKQGGKD